MTGLVVVTGGGRGIGAATALACAAAGLDVCLCYRSNEASARAVVAACEEAGVHAAAVRADVAVEADVLALFAVADRMGTVTALVNNAGIVAPAARVDEFTAERIDTMIRVNVLSTFLCAREAVRRMSTRHGGAGGTIVNVSSRASVIGSAGEYVDYAASKAAVDTLTVGLAREVAAEGIRVNAVRPGLIDTEIHETTSPGRLQRLTPTIPMGRSGRPEEVAAAVVWLLSDAAAYVTGALLDVAGGR